ncbi:acyl-CoA synthetase [Amycolatopsis sp. K13G38]|uniref:Acyl-CoA synthetase n=1 Tax=Amycolatopsis acididurans TaxID=2724524 RepID=A0ABX1JE31_9PSEU|nr:acyl-CoA synthetase [Amycolatopsis acididurans]NKQ57709.1 acyl-CoA synthetase [Amycolatopsis acididurans]
MTRTYRELCAAHRWEIPAEYNMAVDVADHHDRDALALIYEDYTGAHIEVTWAEVQDRSRQVAALLRDLGVRKGDRVAVLLPQRPDTPAVYLGVLRTGAIMVTLSLLWADGPIRERVADCSPAIILADRDGLSRLRGIGGACVIDVDDPSFDSTEPVFDAEPTSPHDPALIFYTSGTTGAAKGIVHAHRSLLGHNEFSYCHDLGPGDVFHGVGDWAWSMAKLLGPLRAGAVHLVYRAERGLDPPGLLDAMSRNRVTHGLVNPTFLRKIRLAVPDAGTRFPQRFVTICCANEPLRPELISWFEEQFGTWLLDYYGSTESYPLLGNFPGLEVRLGSVGRPLPGWEVALLGPDENPVPPGQPGEICLRAGSNPQYPLGYWNRPEESARDFGGKWFHTKDEAIVDDDGFYWVRGRVDDVIKSSGYRIGPDEIEDVVRRLDFVNEVGVVGVADAVKGQALEVWVELKQDEAGRDELAALIATRIRAEYSKFAQPRAVRFVETLPRSATGKVRRAQLREWSGTANAVEVV